MVAQTETCSTVLYNNFSYNKNCPTATVTRIDSNENIEVKKYFATCNTCGERFEQGKNKDNCILCLMGGVSI